MKRNKEQHFFNDVFAKIKCKKKTILHLFLTFSVFLCACQSSTISTKQEKTSLPVLHIGVDELNPFFYVDENGEYKGIDAEIATEACKRAGYEPDFVDIDWSDYDTYLQNKSVDCLWSGFVKNGREEKYAWTDTYMQSDLRIIVDQKNPDKDISTFQARGGVAVRAGSKLEEILLEKSFEDSSAHIYTCGTFEMAEIAFVKGYAAALGGHEVVLEQVIKNHSDIYRFLDGSVMKVELGVAFRKEDTSDMYKNINAAIIAMKKDGTLQSILDKYRVKEISFKENDENA